MALYTLEHGCQPFVALYLMFCSRITRTQGHTDIHANSFIRSFQHWISCQLHHCRIDEGLHVKLTRLWRFHDTRLLQRAMHEDNVSIDHELRKLLMHSAYAKVSMIIFSGMTEQSLGKPTVPSQVWDSYMQQINKGDVASMEDSNADVFLRVPKRLLNELDVRANPVLGRIECDHIRRQDF